MDILKTVYPVNGGMSFLWRGVLDTTLCDKVCQRLATGRWFSLRVLWFPPSIKLTATEKVLRVGYGR